MREKNQKSEIEPEERDRTREVRWKRRGNVQEQKCMNTENRKERLVRAVRINYTGRKLFESHSNQKWTWSSSNFHSVFPSLLSFNFLCLSLFIFHSYFLLLLSLFSIKITLLKMQLLSLVTLTSWTITSCKSVAGMAVEEEPIRQGTYIVVGTVAHPSGVRRGSVRGGSVGKGSVGRSHGVNGISMDLIVHYDVALSQEGIDPVSVGPNHRLGKFLRTEDRRRTLWSCWWTTRSTHRSLVWSSWSSIPFQ